MKRASRKPSDLSESLHRQLNSYALAASAAGVGALALTPPAAAKIVYTPAYHVIGSGQNYPIDLNHDIKADFLIQNFPTSCATYTCFRELRARPETNTNGIEARGVGELSFALALNRGARIGSNRSLFFYGQEVDMATLASSRCQTSCQRGYWLGVQNRYLGLAFKIRGKTHYGWARFNVGVSRPDFLFAVILTGYAYETIPNKAIIAGKTHGPDVITLEPATLGHLARGASAIPAWRQKEQ